MRRSMRGRAPGRVRKGAAGVALALVMSTLVAGCEGSDEDCDTNTTIQQPQADREQDCDDNDSVKGGGNRGGFGKSGKGKKGGG